VEKRTPQPGLFACPKKSEERWKPPVRNLKRKRLGCVEEEHDLTYGQGQSAATKDRRHRRGVWGTTLVRVQQQALTSNGSQEARKKKAGAKSKNEGESHQNTLAARAQEAITRENAWPVGKNRKARASQGKL